MRLEIDYLEQGSKRKRPFKAEIFRSGSGLIDTLGDDKNMDFKKIKFISPRIKSFALISAVNQLAVMTQAGISLKDAVKEAANSTADKRLKQILISIEESLNQGKSLTGAAAYFASEIGEISVAMIRLGESTGRIGEALLRLSDILQETSENKRKFKKAIRYPSVVVSIVAVAFAVLMNYVVPSFKDTFEQLGSQLPPPTVLLVNLNDFLAKYQFFILFSIASLCVILKILYDKNEKAAYKIDKSALKIYLVKDIIFYSTMNRFNLVLSELISAGLPVTQALDTAVLTVQNRFMKSRLSGVKTLIEHGSSLTNALEYSTFYDGMSLAMIKAGEKSGNLETMMQKITLNYKAKFNDIVDNISAYIEPLLISFIAVILIFLALGIFMPIWDLAQAAKI